MSIGTRTIDEAERTTTAVSRDTRGAGIAMRMAFIGACLSAIGMIALVAGGIAALTALVLAVCGGVVAFVSLRFLTRWNTAQPELSAIEERQTPALPLRSPVALFEMTP